MDQDYGQMVRMSTLSNVYNAYSHYRNARGNEIHNLTEGERKILRYLKDSGIIFKA